MIRRAFQSAAAPSWLLISQVEHARISGLLARQWSADDLSPSRDGAQQLPVAVRQEILDAVTHHDDGWTAWEATPRIDPEHGRPYSFMNELPLEESLGIWDESVASARHIGTLAGWMVASHFSALLEDGNHAADERAAAWLQAMEQRRHDWLAEWQQASRNHSLALAERALRLLQACDYLSLWLCCDCPAAVDETVERVAPFELHWPEHGIGPYRFTAQRRSEISPRTGASAAQPAWQFRGEPWPFGGQELDVRASAWLVPARHYASARELAAQRQLMDIRWTLIR